MVDDSVIFARPCANHPDLSVFVARTIVGTYRMVFRDDEAGAIIETRIFTSCMRAYDAAQLLINQP